MDDKEFTLDSRRVRHGIRTIKLDQGNNDFRFELNGHRIYAKGANYCPPDMFISRMHNPAFKEAQRRGKFPTLSNLTHADLVKTMVLSNYNMIRLWGGGHYETD